MRILAIISAHGDELLGPELLQYMLAHRLPLLEQIEFIVANPRAYSQNIRYCESDLNRSYGLDLDTYEAKRARIIAERIRLLQPELVLDFHTTTAEQPDLLITSNLEDNAVSQFIGASVTKNILVVEPLNDITTVAAHFVAYEVSNSHLGDKLYEQICADIGRYLNRKSAGVEHITYKMVGKILPEEVRDLADLKNFTYSEILKSTPSFIGEKAYNKDSGYVGFKIDLVQDE